jgi:signal transduction histidine kinase
LDRVRSELADTDIEAFETNSRELEALAAALHPAALATDPFLGDAARRSESDLRSFLSARAYEAATWKRLSFKTAGGRIDLAARQLAQSIENALDERDRWRVYLLLYATALLIVLGYAAMRGAAALRHLRAENDDLHKRVGERSSDLAQTLRSLKESEAQLVQCEKMSSLGRLAAGVAHEINRPLAFVKDSLSNARSGMPDLRAMHTNAERLITLMRSRAADPRELEKALDALDERLAQLRTAHVLDDLESLSWDGLKGVEQIVELVSNLRSFSRLDRSKVASFNVNDGVQATLLIAKPMLRRVDVDKALGDVPSITCSPSQVNQVLLNLITNAVQAIDKPRGRITVTTRLSPPEAIAIEVADNGKGIASDALSRIFDPFFTTKEAGKGTGLGLSVAHRIVGQHGGRIDVRSQVGVGSTFTVTLPVHPPPDLPAGAEADRDARA